MRKTGMILAVAVLLLAVGAIFVTRSRAPRPDRTPEASPAAHVALPAESGKEVVFGTLGAEPPRSPAMCESISDAAFAYQVYEGLVGFDEDLRIIPRLATSWTVSDDLTTYSFVLREGVRFHDGAPLRASDVVASFERFAKETPAWFWVLAPIRGSAAFRAGTADRIEGIRATGPLAVEIRLDEPDGIFVLHLAIAQATIYKPGPEGAPALGTGPYRPGERRGDDVVFRANPDYWGERPKIERLVFRSMRQISVAGSELRITEVDRAQALRTGSVHAVGFESEGPRGIDPTWLRTYPSLSTDYAYFAPEVPHDVRAAVNAAFDREGYCRDVLQGLAVPAWGVVPPGMRGYTPSPSRPGPAEAEAPAGARAAPYELPAQLEQPLFDRLAAALRPRGIALVDREPYRLVHYAWIADYADPDDFLRVLFHSKSPQNRGGYAHAEVDELLEKARRLSADLEDETRMDLYRKIEARIVADAPWLFLWHRRNCVAVSPKLRGLRTCALDMGGDFVLPQTRLELAD